MCLNYRGANHGGFVEGAAVAPGGQPAAAADVNAVASCSLHLVNVYVLFAYAYLCVHLWLYSCCSLNIYIIHHLQSARKTFDLKVEKDF